MNVLNNVITDVCQYTCAEITSMNPGPWRQFWETRTEVWTMKYKEKCAKNGKECDPFDRHSTFIVLIEGSLNMGQVIAGCRLIHVNDGSMLPVAGCAYDNEQIVGKAAEVSRFFFKPSFDIGLAEREILFKQFVHGIVTSLKGQGYDRAYATIRASLFKKIAKFGVPMDRIGPDQTHAEKAFIPARMFEQAQEPTLSGVAA